MTLCHTRLMLLDVTTVARGATGLAGTAKQYNTWAVSTLVTKPTITRWHHSSANATYVKFWEICSWKTIFFIQDKALSGFYKPPTSKSKDGSRSCCFLILRCSTATVIYYAGFNTFSSQPIPQYSGLPRYWAPSREATDTNFNLFGLTRSGIVAGTCLSTGGHLNHLNRFRFRFI